MEKHINNLGTLFIIWGIISIMFGLGILILATGGFLHVDHRAAAILLPMGIIISFFSISTGIMEITGGRGLIRHQRWARTLIIIMGVINLMSFPLGMALGVYALWVLFKTESEQILIV
jgi:hypothetical protein